MGTGPLRTYVVEVEEGIPIDPAAFAAAVDATLADPRGWTAPGDVSLQRVGPDDGPVVPGAAGDARRPSTPTARPLADRTGSTPAARAPT